MPIYDYQCSCCGHKDEVMRKISAASVETCPACGAETFSKQLSAPSFQLSGSGWYATDFKNGTSKPVSSNEAAGKDVASKDVESKVESASEKKSDISTSPTACATGCACH